MKKTPLLACLLLLLSSVAMANLVNEEEEIYVARPLITEPAWTETGAYLKSFLFDMPNAISRPDPQVGFVFTPGFTWSLFGILELNLGMPLVLNPDESGGRELEAAKRDPSLKARKDWDEHPDFDLPGLTLGLKGNILGKKAEDRTFLALGISASLPIFESFAISFDPWKTAPHHTSPVQIAPYLALGYTSGRFSPQMQVGLNFRFHQLVDPLSGQYLCGDRLCEKGESISVEGYTDLFFNVALPFAFPFEGTVPMLELNGVYNLDDQTAQLFITPAVTFLPKGSPAWLGFACMVPVLDSAWRKNEGFRFMVNFSYKFDALAVPAFWEKEQGGGGDDESPPAGW